jgi:hypothetical protein
MGVRNSIPRIHARKSRIRQRLNRNLYGRKPSKFSLNARLRMAAGLILLVLFGMVTFRQSASSSIEKPYHSQPEHRFSLVKAG